MNSAGPVTVNSLLLTHQKKGRHPQAPAQHQDRVVRRSIALGVLFDTVALRRLKHPVDVSGTLRCRIVAESAHHHHDPALAVQQAADFLGLQGAGLVTVGNELTEQTRSALVDGIVDLVISHPRDALAARTVDVMVEALEQGIGESPIQHLLPFEIYLSENV